MSSRSNSNAIGPILPVSSTSYDSRASLVVLLRDIGSEPVRTDTHNNFMFKVLVRVRSRVVAEMSVLLANDYVFVTSDMMVSKFGGSNDKNKTTGSARKMVVSI